MRKINFDCLLDGSNLIMLSWASGNNDLQFSQFFDILHTEQSIDYKESNCQAYG